ncbi:NAD-dependent glutamate dehydrogenase [Stachybotrys elegans]|uniref:NAD-specific glutamate dehydrogenase n=1 Tax=Stachybotrys elegans TaxID=80388 RepID=A0A8K0WLI3_9HYPO|nr:NAD-dependent glutamate dehydrogenase [Stachybotrys elegans]
MSTDSPTPIPKPLAQLKTDTESSRGPSPQPTHFSVPQLALNNGNGHRILRSATVGYVAPEFTGKVEQMKAVKDIVLQAGWIPEPLVDEQITWFYEQLGIDDVYFHIETPDVIAGHITSLYAAKVAAFTREDKREEIRLDMEAKDHAIYIDTSEPGLANIAGPRYEQRLEAKYLDHQGKSKYRVETFRSPAVIGASPSSKATLRCYFVYQCLFKQNPEDTDPNETRLEVIADHGFWQKATKNTKQVYQDIINQSVNRTGPVIEVYDIEDSAEKRLVVAFRTRTARGLFSALSDLYHYYGVTSSRKYVENFANGITVMSLYLRPAMNLEGYFPPLDESIHQITKEISLLYCLPQNKFHGLFTTGELSLQESVYAHSAWVFVQHFLNRLGPEYASLSEILDPKNNAQAALLSKLKRRLRTETFTPDYILEIIQTYPALVRALYASFANVHHAPGVHAMELVSPSRVTEVLSDEKLQETISKTVSNEHDEMVMTAFRVFNKAILKTNYFTPTKVALSFRLDPSFLPEAEYPKRLYGMFLVIGAESRGFHLRFKDISRGGIRIVKSRSKEAYGINARNLFDENYGLASTQQRKNKDIPEGGSKGVILLDPKQQDKAQEAFEKYIDSILDLLLPAETPGIKNPLVDLYGKEEILFMGPDENTADLVDWATEHARARGAPWWKSFFTGKSPKLGGIPHDKYGMTTLSVREYVKGIYRKLDLDPSKVRKMQTGGPDGDLGSNEILLGNEAYTAIVDGSGVLADPNGLDREELVRLAKKRAMISEYDTSKLSKDGYRVLCEDNNVTLPSGEVVTNGTSFRNTFHLRDTSMTDAFVPCGGRPESIDLISVNRLIKDGKVTIPYIVEGANLFITQDAKLRLEAAGCILYKDASANKGGVTSSSLEVLAALSFDDEGFVQNMCHNAKTGEVPEFYKQYVKQVQEKICDNARLEFEAIWREHEQTGIPRSILSDKLSVAITDLDEQLQHSDLWDNEKIRFSILQDALPRLLLDKIGLETIVSRVPENYLRGIFGSYLASRFVYEFGSQPNQFGFFDFMSKRMAAIEA